MKIFLVFAAIIAVSYANAVGRAGWGSGWANNPALANINIDLGASAAAAGAGSAFGQQALLELVSGSVDSSAFLASIDGVQSTVVQGEDISQISTVNKPSGASSTINAGDAFQEASAVDVLQAYATGANYAAVQNSASTDAGGEGAIAVDAESHNESETGH